MAKPVAYRTKRTMVTQAGLDRNVEMLQRAYALLVIPGFTIHVREGSNKDLGIDEHVVRGYTKGR